MDRLSYSQFCNTFPGPANLKLSNGRRDHIMEFGKVRLLTGLAWGGLTQTHTHTHTHNIAKNLSRFQKSARSSGLVGHG